MSFSQTDHRFMKMALRLATKGSGLVSPNPMVGAVVLRDDQVVGRGWHQRYGEPHAEVMALKAAGNLARGATLYVTLEPCNHHGQTPPCTDAILKAGVARVMAATADPNRKVSGRGADYLKARGVEVEMGLLEDEARHLNEAWFHWVEKERPLVIAKAACSLDGKIATRSGDSQWLTGLKAREMGHRLRHDCDAILVGVGTVLADDPRLTTRLPRRRAKDPIRLVLDSKLRLPPTARLLHLKSSAPTWIATTTAAPGDKIRTLEDLGATVLVTSEDGNRVDLEYLLAELGCRQVQSLLVEGGAEVLGAFFDQNLVDKFYFFYAPKFLGGQQALSVIGGAGVDRLAKAHQARDFSLRRLGPDILVTGYLEKE